MKADDSHLSTLFDGVADAAERGLLGDALRLADSARRYAPGNSTARLIYARSLLSSGHAAAAAELLRGRDEPDVLMDFIEAAEQAGWWTDAGEGCGRLLGRFAVDSLPPLAPTARRLCGPHGERYPGWVGIDSNLCLVGELVDARPAIIEWGDSSLGRIATDLGSPAFSVALPTRAAGAIRVRVEERELLGSGLSWPLDTGPVGWVVLEDDTLHGEVAFDWDLRSPVTVIVASGRHETRFQVDPDGTHRRRAFACRLGEADLTGPQIAVVVLLPDERRAPLLGSPLKLPPPPPVPIATLPPSFSMRAQPREGDRLVNIVVPVYAGCGETLRCLESVFLTVEPHRAVITVVDDASPDLELRAALDGFAQQGRIQLIRNATNLGFPGAVNRGLKAWPELDAVLLNADTEVYPGWLERLTAAAYGSGSIGTVTPLGEEASIVSYGREPHTPYSSAEAARIDRIASRVNAQTVLDIPVGVGFCLYVKRQCLTDTGDFDEFAFGKGYGEESDFCLRARRRGWRHVAAADVFVRHVGGRSFGAAKGMLMQRNRRVINHRHPGYDELVEAFVRKDALRGVRRAIDQQRLIETARVPVLMVTLELDGGVKRHVAARRAALEAEGHSVILLRADTSRGQAPETGLKLEAADCHHLLYDLPVELLELRMLLRALSVTRVELHHFLGLPDAVLELLVTLGAPYQVFVHDYTWVCPRVSFINGQGEYCGEPPVAVCEGCIREHGAAVPSPLTVAELRERSAWILTHATQVTVPTEDVRVRLTRHFPAVRAEVVPWENPPQRRPWAPPPPQRVVRVLLLGAIGTQKGQNVVLECARDAVRRGLPLEFVIVGYSSNDPPLIETGRVFLTGPYHEEEVPALLERERCELAFFPTVGPETWCYTLTHVLAAGMPIVAFDLGAVAERLRAAGDGVLLPSNLEPAALNDELLRVARAGREIRQAPMEEPVPMEEPAPVEAEKGSTSVTETEDPSADLAATVQVLTLPIGLYAFTVQSGAGATPAGDLLLPALHVAPAPARSPGVIEFLSGPGTCDRWLTTPGDVVTVKVTGGDVALLLTSVRAPTSSVLSIDVRRLDAPAPAEPESLSAPAAAPPTSELRVLTLVHVPYLGDLTFVEGWAGKPAENLWIEGFSVLVEEPDRPDLVEYCGVSENGEVTEWVTGGEFCGARGTGVPLVAFAARVSAPAAEEWTCRYRGRFLSGIVVGPLHDGGYCRSDSPGDPLVAMELLLEPLAADDAAPGG